MIPQHVIEILVDVGQVAAELPTEVEGHREFISVGTGKIKEIDLDAYRRRFPYLKNHDIFTVWRFRVLNEVVEDDIDIWEPDMIDLQKMYVNTIDEVEAILKMWQFDPSKLLPPKQTDIPI